LGGNVFEDRHAILLTVSLGLVVAIPTLTRPVQAADTAVAITEDAYVSQLAPDRILSGRARLRVDDQPRRVAFLKFDLADVELEEEAAVTLEVYAFRPHAGFEVRSVDSAQWSEDEITYTNAPEADSEGVQVAAGKRGWTAIDVVPLLAGSGDASFAVVATSSTNVSLGAAESRFGSRLVVESEGAVETPEPTDTESPGVVPGEIPSPGVSESPGVVPGEIPSPGVSESPGVVPTESPSPEASPPPVGGELMWQVETDAATGQGDNADDPAIWVNPSDPAGSLIIGTDKATSGGLHVYGLDGKERQFVKLGDTDNVDLRPGFSQGGNTFDLVGASNRTRNTIELFSISPTRPTLEPVGSIPIEVQIYGMCMYHSSASDKFYAFATSEAGTVEQYEIQAQGNALTGRMVRSFDVGSTTEGCVTDDYHGALYVSEEAQGEWRYGAEPDTGEERAAVDSVGSGHLQADVEGATIYDAGGGKGFLIVSSQGDSTFAVYDRADNSYIGSFAIGGADNDGIDESDGIDVTSGPLGPSYPLGLLVVHDHLNAGGSATNFKLVGWDRVAGTLGLGGAPLPDVGPLPLPTPTPQPTEPPVDNVEDPTEGDSPTDGEGADEDGDSVDEGEAVVSTQVLHADD
jgi:3-phytase